VICRVSRCGFKSRVSLKKHLGSQHDVKDVDLYRRAHNWAPIIAPDAATEKAEKLRERNNRRRAELAELKRKLASIADSSKASKANKKRGRIPEPEESKRYFEVGAQVEKEIPSHLKTDKHSIVAARRLVSTRTRLQVDVVAEYHKRYRRHLAATDTKIPA
jgi:hypothetical protein